MTPTRQSRKHWCLHYLHELHAYYLYCFRTKQKKRGACLP